MKLKGYLTNLGKYNEGTLIGKWITFPIDEDDLNEAFKEIGLNYIDDEGEEINTGYEEYFFTDWECDAEIDLGEYESIEDMNEFAERLLEWEGEEDKFAAACEYEGIKYVLNTSPDDWLLLENVNTDEDLGRYYAEEVGCIDFGGNEILERYFDYDAYGRDIRLEGHGIFTDYGWIENLK